MQLRQLALTFATAGCSAVIVSGQGDRGRPAPATAVCHRRGRTRQEALSHARRARGDLNLELNL